VNGDGGVWLVTGIQAAGKSTVADLLARQFDPAVHIRGGQFYRWATSGWVHPGGSVLTDRARRLLDLRYRLSALTADEYCDAGFTSVVQDNIFGADVVRWLEMVRARPRRLVVLRPSKDVVAAREAERHARTGKVAYRPGEFSIDGLDAALGETPRIGLWLDTTDQTPKETVREIMLRATEATIG
jgi:AAA domain-containing protein